jgi:hypothetical protein
MLAVVVAAETPEQLHQRVLADQAVQVAVAAQTLRHHGLEIMELPTLEAVAVEVDFCHLIRVQHQAQEDQASLSSRSTNKDIHAKQSLSILWN